MTEVFVVRNQLGHYWGKSKTWVDGSAPKTVMRTSHQDEAINTLFELSSKDVALRGEVIKAQLSERGEPDIEPSTIPLPELPGEDEEKAETADLQSANEPSLPESTNP